MNPGDIVTVYGFPLRDTPHCSRGPELYRARLEEFRDRLDSAFEHKSAIGPGLIEYWHVVRLGHYDAAGFDTRLPVWIAVKVVRGGTVPEFGYYKPSKLFLTGWPYKLEVNQGCSR